MSSDSLAIRVNDVSKCFTLYERPGDRLRQFLLPRADRALRREPRRFYREFWALHGLSLTVHKGETVGIVGRNGSGKSTLLQLIAGTLTPTAGQIDVVGRVAALLELGSGFDLDFSGRDNVYLNGAVLGLTRDEIHGRFEQIERFAELGEFIDQPVRTYSSGMVVRLAFAVAISIEPDILVIDEALAVGDEAFQRKCYARINELKERGTTILFVSHSPSSITELCDRAVLIDAGERVLTGHPKVVVQYYQKLLYALPENKGKVRDEIRELDRTGTAATFLPEPADGQDAPVARKTRLASERFDAGMQPSSTVELPSRGARIVDPHLENMQGERVNVLEAGGDYVYTYEVDFTADSRQVIFGMLLKSVSGIELFGMASHPIGESIGLVEAGSALRVEFRFTTRLRPGCYFLNAGCMGQLDSGELEFLHRIFDAVMFRVELPETDRMNSGFYDLALEPACRWSNLGARG